MRTLTILKQDGKLATSEVDILQGIRDMLAPRGNGEYRLLLDKVKRRRTVDQNRLMWLWLSCISEETGNTPQELHDIYCSKFLARTADFRGETIWVVSGTSGLTTSEFSAFLDRIQAHAASELGITLPNPDDATFGAFETYYSRRV